MQNELSWRPDGSGQRVRGHFLGYTPEGKIRVAHGAKIEELSPSEITWEVG